MPGLGPTVTLTFAGDGDNLSRVLDRLSKKSNHFSEDIRKSSGVAALGLGALTATAAAVPLAVAGALAAVPLAFAGIGIAAAAQSEKVKTAFTGLKDHVVKQTQQLAKPFESVLVGIAGRAKQTFDQLAPSLGRIFTATAPMIDKLATSLMSLVRGAMPGFETAIKAVKPILDALGTGLANTGPAIGAFFTNMSTGAQGAATGMGMLLGFINGLLPALGSVLGFLSQWSSVIVPIGLAMTGLAVAVWSVNAALAVYNAVGTVVRAVTAAWAAGQWLLNAALTANPIGIVIVAVAALVAGIIYAWNNCETFRNVVISVWEGIKTAFTAGVAGTKIVFAWFGTLPGLFMGWFTSVKNAIVGKFNEVVGFVGGIPGRFLGALGNIGGLLSGAGQALVNGFLNGIRSAWNSVVSFVASGVAQVRAMFPFSPAKDGPFSGRGYVTYSGKALTTDFAKSLRAGMPSVAQAAADVMGAAHGSLTGSVAVSAPRAAVAGGGGAGSATVTFSGNTSDAVATLIMQLIRTGKIQVAA